MGDKLFLCQFEAARHGGTSFEAIRGGRSRRYTAVTYALLYLGRRSIGPAKNQTSRRAPWQFCRCGLVRGVARRDPSFLAGPTD